MENSQKEILKMYKQIYILFLNELINIDVLNKSMLFENEIQCQMKIQITLFFLNQ